LWGTVHMCLISFWFRGFRGEVGSFAISLAIEKAYQLSDVARAIVVRVIGTDVLGRFEAPPSTCPLPQPLGLVHLQRHCQ
jgi:hypothetical protein